MDNHCVFIFVKHRAGWKGKRHSHGTLINLSFYPVLFFRLQYKELWTNNSWLITVITKTLDGLCWGSGPWWSPFQPRILDLRCIGVPFLIIIFKKNTVFLTSNCLCFVVLIYIYFTPPDLLIPIKINVKSVNVLLVTKSFYSTSKLKSVDCWTWKWWFSTWSWAKLRCFFVTQP